MKNVPDPEDNVDDNANEEHPIDEERQSMDQSPNKMT
jgi:hypothetical protein